MLIKINKYDFQKFGKKHFLTCLNNLEVFQLFPKKVQILKFRIRRK